MDGLKTAIRVFNTEIDCLMNVRDGLDDTFNQVLKLIVECDGKVILTGMGKSGHIARKIAATMTSLGVTSVFMHPAEAAHGDLGIVTKDDLVIALSHSGESSEIISIIMNIRMIGACLVGITGNPDSTLAKLSAVAVVFPEIKEACHLGLAPTSSTTAALVYGDALSVAASEEIGFTKKDFGIFHPSGSLGKKLVYRVTDLMKKNESGFTVSEDAFIKDAVISISKSGYGIVPVLSKDGKLAGVLTDDDIQCAIESGTNIYIDKIKDKMTRNPVCVVSDAMAVDALQIMIDNDVKTLPVVKDGFAVGVIMKSEITNIGIYI